MSMIVTGTVNADVGVRIPKSNKERSDGYDNSKRRNRNKGKDMNNRTKRMLRVIMTDFNDTTLGQLLKFLGQSIISLGLFLINIPWILLILLKSLLTSKVGLLLVALIFLFIYSPDVGIILSFSIVVTECCHICWSVVSRYLKRVKETVIKEELIDSEVKLELDI